MNCYEILNCFDIPQSGILHRTVAARYAPSKLQLQLQPCHQTCTTPSVSALLMCVCACVCGWRTGICVSGPPFISLESVCNFTFFRLQRLLLLHLTWFPHVVWVFLAADFFFVCLFFFFFPLLLLSLAFYVWMHSWGGKNREIIERG